MTKTRVGGWCCLVFGMAHERRSRLRVSFGQHPTCGEQDLEAVDRGCAFYVEVAKALVDYNFNFLMTENFGVGRRQACRIPC